MGGAMTFDSIPSLYGVIMGYNISTKNFLSNNNKE